MRTFTNDIIIITLTFASLMTIVIGYAWNRTPPIWKGLIAEASSEGYEGMKAVALVCRNRMDKGMGIGLNGLKRKDLDKFIRKEGKEKERLAKKIVREVFKERCSDITNGAIYFENIEKFNEPDWLRQRTKTIKLGNHTFYK